jgi:(4-(4-[2-(gamma-L-glutamylamino)ethyl]phenoxymethyl)furan-2-yl)methanamine synthase
MPVPRNQATGWLGWDLGGAHLKAVQLDRAGRVEAVAQAPCPLWQGLDRLDTAIDAVLARLPRRATRHAVTMTGELADLFEDRVQGVRALTGFIERRFAGEVIRVYAGPEGLLDTAAAVAATALVASANWMASASLAATRFPQGLLVDIGSTTTDLVPFRGGRVIARGYADHERLALAELVYSGVARTPVMALARGVPFNGSWVPLMAEHFATTADLYRLTGELPDHADLMASADGRPKTAQASAGRVARMLGLDAGAADPSAWRRVAGCLTEAQLRTLVDAAERLFSRGEVAAEAPLLGAGVGRFLARHLAERLGRAYLGFESLFEGAPTGAPDVADCAPAAAVARLALDLKHL